MKNKIINIIIICIVVFSASSYKNKNNKPDIVFPGTVFIENNLFFDIQEVTNIDWKEYMHWVKGEKGEYSLEYKNTIPDTTVWDGRYLSFQNTYFSHPKFNNYPVVGIRYDQAAAFCKWRTEIVKEMLDLKKKKNTKMYLPKFEYRLPKKAEWELVANVGYSEKTQKEIDKAIKKNPYDDPKKQTAINSAKSYWPNAFGVYGLRNNVSEYVLEKGIAKGGNFTLSADKALIEQEVKSVQREKWLGFRCVCEIIE